MKEGTGGEESGKQVERKKGGDWGEGNDMRVERGGRGERGRRGG